MLRGLAVFLHFFYQPASDLTISYTMLYWQSQSTDLSVTPASVMMATSKSCVVSVLLCIVYAVTSVKIKGTIKHYSDYFTPEMEVSEYVTGDSWNNPWIVTLDRLVEGDYLPTLTVTNFKATSLIIGNISLENVPVFENVSIDYLSITANKIKTVLTNAFNGARVQSVHLDNNKIQSMSIRSLNMDVRKLYLRCNKLGNFPQAWFKDPSSISELHLSSNRIESIADQAFNQMTRLSDLFLDNNHITRIGVAAFSSGIAQLHLEFNNISQIAPDVFESSDKSMWSLYIHHNLLSYLPEALLVKVKPQYISLDDNPWQCQCLTDIERWLREQNIKRRNLLQRHEEPACVAPLNFVGVCIPAVDKELQQKYTQGRSPVEECWTGSCNIPCLKYR